MFLLAQDCFYLEQFVVLKEKRTVQSNMKTLGCLLHRTRGNQAYLLDVEAWTQLYYFRQLYNLVTGSKIYAY